MFWLSVDGMRFRTTGRAYRMCRPRRWQGHTPCVHAVVCENLQIYLTWDRKCGLQLAGYRKWVGGPPQDGGHFGEGTCLMNRRSVRSLSSSGPTHLAAMETRCWTDLMALTAHCAVVRYGDGTPRKPGWITVQTAGSSWCVVAKDPDAAAQLRVTAPTLDEALSLLNALLDAEDAPWEPDGFLAARSGKKK